MIRIIDKRECCGCEACVQVCPKHCIDFSSDYQGFCYPHVDEAHCINCGLCEKVCPIINVTDGVYEESLPVYASYNSRDDERKSSSSGGLFSLLANKTLDENGVVFGAMFDDKWNVVHGYVTDAEKLDSLKRSKYVQSQIGNNYTKVKKFLNDGKLVLFVGTPCQIAGLKSYLRKDYDNLLAVDVACHGVPSPMVWQKYLTEKKEEFANRNGGKNKERIEITHVSFRSKEPSWRRYHLSFTYKVKGDGIDAISADSMSRTSSTYIWDDDYMLSFLHDFINRPSCFDCKFRNGKSRSDMTLADFWCIEKWTNLEEFVCDKGTSLVLVHTAKGKDFFHKLDSENLQLTLQEAVYGNPALLRNWPKPIFHDLYFMLCKYLSVSCTYRIVSWLQDILVHLSYFKSKFQRLINKIIRN